MERSKSKKNEEIIIRANKWPPIFLGEAARLAMAIYVGLLLLLLLNAIARLELLIRIRYNLLCLRGHMRPTSVAVCASKCPKLGAILSTIAALLRKCYGKIAELFERIFLWLTHQRESIRSFPFDAWERHDLAIEDQKYLIFSNISWIVYEIRVATHTFLPEIFKRC